MHKDLWNIKCPFFIFFFYFIFTCNVCRLRREAKVQKELALRAGGGDPTEGTPLRGPASPLVPFRQPSHSPSCMFTTLLPLVSKRKKCNTRDVTFLTRLTTRRVSFQEGGGVLVWLSFSYVPFLNIVDSL